MKRWMLLPLMLLLLLSVSFAQNIAMVQSPIELGVQPSVEKVSAGFDLSKDAFKNMVISATGKKLDPIDERGSIKTAYISSAGQDLASVNLKSDLGAFKAFKGRYAPVFSSCVWMTCTIIYEATPTVDYAYQAGDFEPVIDVASGVFKVVSVSYNYSEGYKVVDYNWVNLTGKFQTVVSSHQAYRESWADISTMKQKANVPVKIKVVVSREQLGQTADIQPRAYGSLITQWGIYTDPLWGTTDCIVNTVGANTTITATNGTCTVNFTASVTMETLIVAGGGGGGAQIGGGGGAGGYLFNSSMTSGINNYTLVVGAKGVGAVAGGGAVGTKGGNSWIANTTLTTYNASGGGYGGSETGGPGANGGSGGGGSYYATGGTNVAGTGVASQGNNGGTGSESPRYDGGGGGVGSAGASGTNTVVGGPGGTGRANSISGAAYTFSCGGGGGTDAMGAAPGVAGCANAGGGGTAGAAGGNAAVNSGSGGGGGGYSSGSAGGDGGSGSIILNFVEPTAATANMSSVGTGVNPINVNSAIGWNASANTTSSTFQGFNWTIYKNGVNTTSGNYTCNGGVCSNNTQYVVKNDTPGTYAIGDQLIFSARAYTTNAVVNSTYLNSTTYTVGDNIPAITNLMITPNSTTSTIYANMTTYGNITAQDNDTSQTLTVSYSWYKNGVNQTALAGTFQVFNGTANWTGLDLSVYGTAGDSWIFGAQVNDSFNWTAPANSTATLISGFISNLTMNSTTLEYDLLQYSHGINFTSSPGVTITGVSASLTGSGSVFAGTLTSSSGGAQRWNVTVQPPFETTQTNYTVTFGITGTLSNGTAFSQSNVSAYTVTVNVSGIYACAGVITQRTLNYSFYDLTTSASINATLTALFNITSANGTIKATSFTATNNTLFVCITPTGSSFNVGFSETANASGYQTSIVGRSGTANTTVQNISMFLLNTTLSQATILTVLQYPLIPLANSYITIEQFTAPSNYSLFRTCTTGNDGTCLVYLTPNTIYYRYNVTTASGTVSFGPETLSCSPTAATCARNFIINGVQLPYAVIGNFSGSCVFNTTTNILNCTGLDLGTTLVRYNLTSSYFNSTVYCTNTSTSNPSTLTCSFPNTTMTYRFGFFGLDASNNFYLLSSSEFTINQPAPTFGRSGWIAMLFLFMIIAMAGFQSPGLSIVLGLVALLFGAIVGFVPMGSIQQVIVVAATMGGVLMWRLRV